GSQLDGYWTDQKGNITVVNSAATGTVAGTSLSTVNGINVADVMVTGDIALALGGQTVGLVARYSGPGSNNFYFGQLAATTTGFQASIWKNIDGTLVLLALGSTVRNATGALSFKLTGSSLELSLDDTVLASAIDTSLTTGSVGMRLSLGATLDNFSAS